MIYTSHTEQLLALHYVYPLTVKKLQAILSPIDYLPNFESIHPTDLAALWHISVDKASQIVKHYSDIRQYPLQAAYLAEHIHPVPYTHQEYPASLFELIDAPAVIYVKGDRQLLVNPKKIAVIGARKATAYTLTALQNILPPLIEQQYVIVSGLAIGADKLAHEATIAYGGQTIGVLGFGFHHMYPKENALLAQTMALEQLLITEYPPYVKPEKWHFPMRNRLISGLSRALVVTEAALKSGTMITTEHALDHGKDVFVVPGPITSKLSMGTNKLLQEGATPVWNGYQIVEELRTFSRYL